MQKGISILLLFCLCVSWMGFHAVFYFQLAQVKSEMKAFLQKKKDDKDVLQICLRSEEAKQLEWENENEFRYNNDMYDVIEKKTSDQQIVIRCIADKKETSLLNEYLKNNKRNSSNSTVVQLITVQFILPSDYSLKQPEKIIKEKFFDHSFALHNLASKVLLPPPDVC